MVLCTRKRCNFILFSISFQHFNQNHGWHLTNNLLGTGLEFHLSMGCFNSVRMIGRDIYTRPVISIHFTFSFFDLDISSSILSFHGRLSILSKLLISSKPPKCSCATNLAANLEHIWLNHFGFKTKGWLPW